MTKLLIRWNKPDQMNTHTLCTTQWGSDPQPPINSRPAKVVQPNQQASHTSRGHPASPTASQSQQSTGQPPQSPEPIGLQKITSPKLTQYICRSLPHPCWPKPQPDQKSHHHPHNQPINQVSPPVQAPAYRDPHDLQWTLIIQLSYSTK